MDLMQQEQHTSMITSSSTTKTKRVKNISSAMSKRSIRETSTSSFDSASIDFRDEGNNNGDMIEAYENSPSNYSQSIIDANNNNHNESVGDDENNQQIIMKPKTKKKSSTKEKSSTSTKLKLSKKAQLSVIVDVEQPNNLQNANRFDNNDDDQYGSHHSSNGNNWATIDDSNLNVDGDVHYSNDGNILNEEPIVTQVKLTRKKSSDQAGKNAKNKVKKSKKNYETKETISVDQKAKQSFEEPNCPKCGKITYTMEKIKAVGGSWHKSCFKCTTCNKQLNVDTFEGHEGNLYCKPHFKILMGPKVVENFEPERPKKHELIIRENQPIELPPDVVRASDKSDLGLEELQQLNVRSRFQVFENYQENRKQKEQHQQDRSIGEIKRSQSILQKLARFQKEGKLNSNNNGDAESDQYGGKDSKDESDEEPIDSAEEDPDLVRAKRAQRERPMRFDQMNDIKSKFERGQIQTREERREERKLELQNIRSRLFMGKQARIKEQYQQAVHESEQGIVAANKRPELDIGDKAKALKEKFEKGEMFKERDQNRLNDEMDVFESGISKQSRSLFMELDATAAKPPPAITNTRTPSGLIHSRSNVSVNQLQELLKPFNGENVVKYDEKPEDIKIETCEISSKFKFFETYKAHENQKNREKKLFRITPPREGVVKMPSPDDDHDDDDQNRKNDNQDEPLIAAQQHTTTKMLSRFRELEKSKHLSQDAKPLKRFTPPPDQNRRIFSSDNNDNHDGYDNEEDEEEYEDEYEAEEDEEEEVEIEQNDENSNRKYKDEFLKMAQSAARAKQLRAKFEKWEANEIKREMNNEFNLHDNIEESQIESAKSLRAKFEELKNQSSPVSNTNRPKIQVNRFV